MAIELVPLCTLHIQLKPPIEVGAGPCGTRLIFEAADGHVQGDRLRGEMVGVRNRGLAAHRPGGHWNARRPDDVPHR